MILLRWSPTKEPKRGGKYKGSSAKRSNSVPSPTFNVCFTNSQEFNSLVANSAKLDGITSRGNNESTAVRNISNERLSMIILVQIVLKDQVKLLITVVQIALDQKAKR